MRLESLIVKLRTNERTNIRKIKQKSIIKLKVKLWKIQEKKNLLKQQIL